VNTQATFRVAIPGQMTGPDVLGVWQTVPAQTPPVPGPEDDQVTIWQADLPADLRLAAAALDQRDDRLLIARQAIPWAAWRLEAFVLEAPPADVMRTESYAFSLTGELQPERELGAWLLAEQGEKDFGRLDDLRAGLRQTAQHVSAFSEQLRRTLTNLAWVRTTSGGQTLGRTSVSWLGDVDTLWECDLSVEQAALHRRALALALSSRQAWIRLFLLVAASAVRLSTLFGTGIASPLAIAATYRFITQVVAEFSQLRQTISPPT
jgi:hypothetical protein